MSPIRACSPCRAGADDAYETAKTVIVESDEIVDDRKAAAALMMQPELTMFTDGKSIKDFLQADEQEKLTAGLKQRGIPLTLVAKMKPWMIASFVALPACEMSRKAAGASFLDKKLAEDALKQGKSAEGAGNAGGAAEGHGRAAGPVSSAMR